MTESTLKLPAVLIESELERLAQISEPGKYRKKSHEITPLTRSMKILAEQDITVEMVERLARSGFLDCLRQVNGIGRTNLESLTTNFGTSAGVRDRWIYDLTLHIILKHKPTLQDLLAWRTRDRRLLDFLIIPFNSQCANRQINMLMSDLSDFGQNFIRKRFQHGMSRHDFMFLYGIDQRQAYHYEHHSLYELEKRLHLLVDAVLYDIPPEG